MANPIAWIATKVADWVVSAVVAAGNAVGLSPATTATIAGIAAKGAYGLVYVGAAVLPGMLNRPNLPDPAEGTEPTNQTRPEIQLGTGRARLSGPRLMWEGISGWNIEIIALHEGPVDGFETFYLNDEVVTLDGDGWVQEQAGGRYGHQCIRILTRKGEAGEEPFQEIIDLCAAAGLSELYTEAHYAHGVAKMAVLCKAVDDADVLRVYPNGPPKGSAVTRLSKVYDWRDPTQDLMDPTTWKWSDNAQVNHAHYEWMLRWLPIKVGDAGWIQGDGRPPPDWCLKQWKRHIEPFLDALTYSADVCDELVDLKAGGQEKRYRQGGWWRSLNQAADIRRRFFDCYDGRMNETGIGAFLFGAGKYDAPDYFLTDRNMVEAAWNRGAPDREQTNVLIGNFTSPEHDWSPQPSDAWRDDEAVARQGEKSAAIDLTWVPSHAQCRRLLKRIFVRMRASAHGPIIADLEGLNVLRPNSHGRPRRVIGVRRKNGPPSMREVDVEVMRARIDLMNGRVPLEVIRAEPNVDSWNALTEEGTAPPTTARAPRVIPPTPEIVSVTPETAAGVTRLRIVVEDPSRPGLMLSARTRPTGEVSWKEGSPQSTSAVTGGLEILTGEVDPVELDVQCAFWSGGERGDWSDIETTDAEPSDDPADVALAAWLDAIPNQPGPTRLAHYRDLFAGLRPGDPTGPWEQLDELWLEGTHDSPSSLIGLKGHRQATVVGTVNFLASRGHQGDGSTGRVDTGVDPSVGGLQFTRNAAHQGVWCLTEGADSTPVCGNTQSRIIPRNATDNIVFRANSASSASVATASALGHTCWVRDGASSTRLYRNGVMISPGASASADFIPGEKLWICGSDNTGTDSFSTKRIAAFHIGGQLTDTQAADLHAALETYLTAVGAV